VKTLSERNDKKRATLNGVVALFQQSRGRDVLDKKGGVGKWPSKLPEGGFLKKGEREERITFKEKENAPQSKSPRRPRVNDKKNRSRRSHVTSMKRGGKKGSKPRTFGGVPWKKRNR